MTVAIGVLNGKIVFSPPITSKFLGQSFENIVKWMRKQGGFVTSKFTQSESIISTEDKQ